MILGICFRFLLGFKKLALSNPFRYERGERQPGCTCCCHIAAAVTVMPRSATFTPQGGLSTHTLMNTSESRENSNLYKLKHFLHC